MHQLPRRFPTSVAGRLLVVGLCAAAALLLVGSVERAWVGANDFQWGGARFLVKGMDPYQALFRQGRHAFPMTQFPNYSPLLYVLLIPLGLLPLSDAMPVWAVLNLAMYLAATWLVIRAVGLRGGKAVTFVAAFVCSEAFVTSVGMGQQTALVLLGAVLGIRLAGRASAGGALGVMLVKYSFVPVLLVPLMRRQWRALLVAALLQGAGLVAFCAITGSGPVSVALSPFRAARLTQGPGAGDVTTLARLLGWSDPVAFGLAAVCALLLAWSARQVLRSGDWVDALAVASLISLIALPHLIHDYCFLMPVAASASRLHGWARAVVWAVVAGLWWNWTVGHFLAEPYVVSGVATTLVLLTVAFVVLVGSLEARTLSAARRRWRRPVGEVAPEPTGRA